jgi:hypothetical protein
MRVIDGAGRALVRDAETGSGGSRERSRCVVIVPRPDLAYPTGSSANLQPSVARQLGGWYLQTNPTIKLNWADRTQTVPVNLRPGRVADIGRQRWDFYLHPEHVVSTTAASGERWGIKLGVRLPQPVAFWR